jgi:chemotaxis family two-component system response regulator Rcp1
MNRLKILLVEDNPADVELTRENLAGSKILHDLYVARDGREALAFLRKEAPFEDAPRPELILLDLNLPGTNGYEVLKEIKHDQYLLRIPVVVLTSSEAEEDILKSYNLHANAYISKPVDLRGFSKIVRGIEHFWFAVVSYSPNGGHA